MRISRKAWSKSDLRVSFWAELRVILFVCLVVLASGCQRSQELESGLDSSQSTEMVVVLRRAGISAQRHRLNSGREGSYTVMVPSALYSKALEVVYEFKLPSRPDGGIEQFTRQQGFTPNSSQINKLRLDFALALQIERILKSFPGVVEAKVLVSSHLSQLTASSNSLSGASVSLRYTASNDSPPVTEEQIIDVVAQAVPKISSENIKVTMSKVELPAAANLGSAGGSYVPLHKFLPNIRVPVQDMPHAGYVFLMYLTVLLAAGVVGGAFLSSFFLKSKALKMRKSNYASRSRREAIAASAEIKKSGRLLGNESESTGASRTT